MAPLAPTETRTLASRSKFTDIFVISIRGAWNGDKPPSNEFVNGTQTSYTLNGTSGTWANSTPVAVTLKTGVNSIRLNRVTGGNWVRLDRLVIASDAPLNPEPPMQITSYKRTSPTTSSLTVTAIAGHSYVVESSETLQETSWQPLLEFVAESDQMVVNFRHPTAPRLFFRIRKVP